MAAPRPQALGRQVAIARAVTRPGDRTGRTARCAGRARTAPAACASPHKSSRARFDSAILRRRGAPPLDAGVAIVDDLSHPAFCYPPLTPTSHQATTVSDHPRSGSSPRTARTVRPARHRRAALVNVAIPMIVFTPTPHRTVIGHPAAATCDTYAGARHDSRGPRPSTTRDDRCSCQTSANAWHLAFGSRVIGRSAVGGTIVGQAALI
jgi:hypothetical protein